MERDPHSKPHSEADVPHKTCAQMQVGSKKSGGEGGIRTPDRLAPMPHFECGAFNHSATSPEAPYRSCGPCGWGVNRRGWRARQGAKGENPLPVSPAARASRHECSGKVVRIAGWGVLSGESEAALRDNASALGEGTAGERLMISANGGKCHWQSQRGETLSPALPRRRGRGRSAGGAEAGFKTCLEKTGWDRQTR